MICAHMTSPSRCPAVDRSRPWALLCRVENEPAVFDGRHACPPSERCQALHQRAGLPEHLDDLVPGPVLEGAYGGLSPDLILVEGASRQLVQRDGTCESQTDARSPETAP